tara:strand:- start:579 stop:1010 length:432 start_codon:yes stop_codon:yes gene_type:complete
MKTPNELKKIYNRLPKDKTELAIHKVELNLVQDLDKLNDEIQDDIDGAKDLENEIDSQAAKIRDLIDELRKTAEEAKDYQENLKGWGSEVKALETKVKAAAEALGAKPGDVKGYDFMKSQLKSASEASKDMAYWIKFSNKFKY